MPTPRVSDCYTRELAAASQKLVAVIDGKGAARTITVAVICNGEAKKPGNYAGLR